MKRKQTMTAGVAIFAALLLASCQKTPALDKLSDDFVVMTKVDTAAKFKNYVSFSIRDTIAIATGNKKDSVWYDADAQKIIQAVGDQMKAAGYVRIAKSAATDLGVQISAARNVSYFNVTPGYWWGYDGFITPCYWWNECYPYYYPYWYSYSVKTGTLLIEIVDLKNAGAQKKLNVIWTAAGSGQIGNSQTFIMSQCLKTVDQAFKQSPYIKAY